MKVTTFSRLFQLDIHIPQATREQKTHGQNLWMPTTAIPIIAQTVMSCRWHMISSVLHQCGSRRPFATIHASTTRLHNEFKTCGGCLTINRGQKLCQQQRPHAILTMSPTIKLVLTFLHQNLHLYRTGQCRIITEFVTRRTSRFTSLSARSKQPLKATLCAFQVRYFYRKGGERRMSAPSRWGAKRKSDTMRKRMQPSISLYRSSILKKAVFSCLHFLSIQRSLGLASSIVTPG